MQALTIRSLRTILVVGALFLATVTTAAAQQEVSPDHFEGPGAGPAKAHVTKVHKQTASHKQTAKQVANKKSSNTDVAGK